MKHYNKILEAVNRGIQFALDDFEYDDIIEQLPKKEIIRDNDYIQITIDRLFKKLKTMSLTSENLNILTKFCNATNTKYKVDSSVKLKELIVYLSSIDQNVNLNWIDVSEITDMKNLFAHLEEFNGDISEWNTSKVTTMTGMFAYCHNFDGNLSKWDVHNVKDMSNMFSVCGFTGENGDINKWDVSNVEKMNSMFSISPYHGDLSNWNTRSLKETKFMFRNTPYFNSDISYWNVSNVHESMFMFKDSNFDQDLADWDGEELSLLTFKESNISADHLPLSWQQKNLGIDGKPIK